MRAVVVVLTLSAGCEFIVPPTGPSGMAPGTNNGTGGGGTTQPPASSSPTPVSEDAGAATTPAVVDMGHAPIGSACSSDGQCGYGLVCGKSFFAGQQMVQIPGGYCTMDCKNAPCPTGSVCTTFSFGQYCTSSCPPDPCRTAEGYE